MCYCRTTCFCQECREKQDIVIIPPLLPPSLTHSLTDLVESLLKISDLLLNLAQLVLHTHFSERSLALFHKKAKGAKSSNDEKQRHSFNRPRLQFRENIFHLNELLPFGDLPERGPPQIQSQKPQSEGQTERWLSVWTGRKEDKSALLIYIDTHKVQKLVHVWILSSQLRIQTVRFRQTPHQILCLCHNPKRQTCLMNNNDTTLCSVV